MIDSESKYSSCIGVCMYPYMSSYMRTLIAQKQPVYISYVQAPESFWPVCMYKYISIRRNESCLLRFRICINYVG